MPHLSASSALSSSREGRLGSAGSPSRAGGNIGEIGHRHPWLAAQFPRNMAAQHSRSPEANAPSSGPASWW